MEGKWSPRVTDVRSVTPILEALEQAGRARSATHHLHDADDLKVAFRRWGQKQHAGFNIGYVALHGSPGAVHVGRSKVDLFELGQDLPRKKLKSKVLHFDSCSVMDLAPKDRKELRAAMGVKVLTGFTEEVEWFESMAFELLLFDTFTWYKRSDAAESYIKKNHSQMAKRLGFVMVR
jgi:hypothetical protein